MARQDSRREPYSVQESVERLVVNPVFRAAPWDEERLKEHEQDPRVSSNLPLEPSSLQGKRPGPALA